MNISIKNTSWNKKLEQFYRKSIENIFWQLIVIRNFFSRAQIFGIREHAREERRRAVRDLHTGSLVHPRYDLWGPRSWSCLPGRGTHAFQELRPPRVDEASLGGREDAEEWGKGGGRAKPLTWWGEIIRPDYTEGVMDGLICEI